MYSVVDLQLSGLLPLKIFNCIKASIARRPPKHYTKMIAIVTIFMTCHSFFSIFAILLGLNAISIKVANDLDYYDYIRIILINFSASINSLIYCIFNKKFRDIFLKWVTLKHFRKCTMKNQQDAQTEQFELTPMVSNPNNIN